MPTYDFGAYDNTTKSLLGIKTFTAADLDAAQADADDDADFVALGVGTTATARMVKEYSGAQTTALDQAKDSSLATINTSLGTVNTSVGTVNTSVGTTNTKLTSLLGGITATEVATGTADVEGVAPTANLRLFGYSVRENAGSPDVAKVILRKGDSIGDPALAFINLAASGEKSMWFGEKGILCPDGIFVERASGESHLVLYHATIS